MKSLLAAAFLTSTLAVIGCASHDNSDYPDQQANVGVTSPAPNADPNNPTLTHKGVSQTNNGDMNNGSTSGN